MFQALQHNIQDRTAAFLLIIAMQEDFIPLSSVIASEGLGFGE